MKRKIVLITLCILLFLASAAVVAYPLLSNYMAEHRQEEVLVEYQAEIEVNEAVPELLEVANAYNTLLATGQYAEEDLERAAEIFGGKLIGRVDIPAISVSLPIYPSDTALDKGAVHVRGTSLPVGGTSTHAAVSAHSGLSSAKMFTDLEQLQIGDTFTVQCLGLTLTYEVDRISTVLPDDVSKLAIVPNEDYCTLITCTPYGINSHRLLVRGRRIETPVDVPESIPAEQTYQSIWMQEYYRGLAIGGAVAVALITVVLIVILRRRKRNEKGS